jgi:hypothetical protein
MGIPTSEVGYTSASTGRRDREVHKGHVALAQKSLSNSQHKNNIYYTTTLIYRILDMLQDTVTKIPIGESYKGHSFIIQDYVVIFY